MITGPHILYQSKEDFEGSEEVEWIGMEIVIRINAILHLAQFTKRLH